MALGRRISVTSSTAYPAQSSAIPFSKRMLVLAKFWIVFLASMVGGGWLLSLFGHYELMGWWAVPSLLLAFRVGRAGASGLSPQERRELVSALTFAPFLVLLGLVVLAGLLYTTAVLDSLSYRIPRMQIWLQEGVVRFIDNPDARINFMTPIWEFAKTPVYLVSGFRLLWIGSAVSWVLLYLVFHSWAAAQGGDAEKARWVALALASGTGFVLQAASTMNDIWACALIGVAIAFALRFEREAGSTDPLWSGVAFALACGAKPHFAVLALPWLLWFFFAKSRPWRGVAWRWLPLGGAVAILCSPLPTFVSNHIHYGSFKGGAGDGGFGLGGRTALNLPLGGAMLAWQAVQPPVNPVAREIEAKIDERLEALGRDDWAPRFKLSSRELATVDYASLGFVLAVISVAGLFSAWRHRRHLPPWIWWVAASGLFGLAVAVAQVVPGTLGRSFLAFFVPMLAPVALALAAWPLPVLRTAAILAAMSAAFSTAMSPSHPLWPVSTVAGLSETARSKAAPYLAFRERSQAGLDLVDAIPQDARSVGILANADQPLIHLWRRHGNRLEVVFFPATATPSDVASAPISHVVVAGSVEGVYLSWHDKLDENPHFSLMLRSEHQSKNERGRETWSLFEVLSGPGSR